MQILNIHTSKLRKEDKLADDVSLDVLSVETKNFSGAEIEGLVRAAATTSMNKLVKVNYHYVIFRCTHSYFECFCVYYLQYNIDFFSFLCNVFANLCDLRLFYEDFQYNYSIELDVTRDLRWRQITHAKHYNCFYSRSFSHGI